MKEIEETGGRSGAAPTGKSPSSYKDAGVNKEEGYRAVEKMKKAVAATHGPQVLGGLGAFASLYALEGVKDPVLVSGTDGVGTKLRLALDAGKLDVIGRDCYAMVANDILCHGARPLFFLDYLACGKLDAEVAAAIVAGMADACLEDGCALVGGETAEMPGFYSPGDYDVAGFAVGVVEREQMVDGSAVRPGDVIIGLASGGVHSNGYSLIRALFPELEKAPASDPLMQDFLKPTRLYGTAVRRLLADGAPIHGMAHITGGGIPENLPRAFAAAQSGSTASTGGHTAGRIYMEALVDESAWPEPEIFGKICGRGVSRDEMRGTFNMGIGFTLVVDPAKADSIIADLEQTGERAWRIGEIRQGSGDSRDTGGVCYV